MNIRQLVVAAMSAGLIALQAIAAPQGSAVAPDLAAGDIAGYTVTPAGSVTQVSMSVVVPSATTSADCNTPGQFEYAIFGIRLTANTFATVSATCGNQGNVAYFADIEAGSGAAFKNFLLRPGQTVSLAVTVSGTKVTVTASRGSTFKGLGRSSRRAVPVRRARGLGYPGQPAPGADHKRAVLIGDGEQHQPRRPAVSAHLAVQRQRGNDAADRGQREWGFTDVYLRQG